MLPESEGDVAHVAAIDAEVVRGLKPASITSAQLGMEVFLDLAISPKWKMTAPDQRDLAHREYLEICELAKDPQAWGFLGLFLAMGTVPASVE
ncbi:hypothetical protein SCOR_32665 [Sulfidibacter corallicola]|uniref:hypothetical protein n=1 Tax=Sulfidibacter corallicola TaxID=2818388 RepID=UPI002351EE72|nr:hypothetical protein [Sulfidibacter corallicola]